MLSFNFIRRATGTIGAVVLLGLPRASVAAPVDDAEVLMRRGNDLRRAGDDEGALPIFKQAFDLYRSPRTTAQLGLVEWALGRWVDADEHLTEALKAVNTDVWIRTNRGAIEDALKTAKKNVGRVEITGDPVGAEVLVNGRPVGKVPLAQPVRVIAGSVDVELRAPGYRPGFRTISVAGLQHQPLVIRLEKEGTPRDGAAGGLQPVQRSGALGAGDYDADLSDSRPMATWRKASIIGALVGTVLGLGGAGYAGWDYNRQVAAFNKTCKEFNQGAILSSTGLSNEPCKKKRTSYEGMLKLRIVGFSVAGAMAVGAVVLYLTDSGGPGAQASTPAGPRFACAPDLARPGLLCALPF